MTEDTTATGITDEMLKAGAHAMTDARRHYETYNDYAIAERVLRAALAGRTIVQMPEPSSVDEDGDMRWATPTGQAVAYLDYDRGHDLGMVHVSGRFHASPDEAERHALAILAAAREARRLAAESSGEGASRG